eukprot:Rmarinus@m.30077
MGLATSRCRQAPTPEPSGRVLVGKEEDLAVGDFKRIQGDGYDVLVCHTKRGFYAVSGRCTHYDAPLDKGVLKGNRIVCPWHGACFNVETGDMEDSPGVHALAQYEISREHGLVYAKVPPFERQERVREIRSKERILIVGGGAAAVAAVKVLVENNYGGFITMVSREHMLPYDRTRLSKNMKKAMDVEFVRVLDEAWFHRHNIDLRLGVEVVKFDAKEKRAATYQHSAQRADVLLFDKCLLATGVSARSAFGWGSATLQNIFACREFADIKAICSAVDDGSKQKKKVVLIGSSFIAMEAASHFASFGVQGGVVESVTVVMPGNVPLLALGETSGRRFKSLHEEHGVKFVENALVQTFVGKDGKVVGVDLDNGDFLEADLVVTGLGSILNTSFIHGLDLASNGAVLVGEHLETSVPDVYAAGDVVCYPYHITGDFICIGHWATAQQQGRVAAFNLLGQERPFETAPFFWTQQYGKSFRFAGFACAGSEIITEGDIEGLSFLSMYVRNGLIQALASIGRDPQVAAFYELLNLGHVPSLSEAKEVEFNFVKLLRRA